MAVTINIQSGVADASYDNVKDTFPQSAAPTGGTVSTSGRKDYIVGSGTSFLSDFKLGDYIWFTTTDEVVKISNIVSDTELYINKELSGAVSGVAFKVVPREGWKMVSVAVDGAGAANINNIQYPASYSVSYGNGRTVSNGGRRQEPVLIDSTVSGNVVLVNAQ